MRMGMVPHFAKSCPTSRVSARSTRRPSADDQTDVARSVRRRRCLVPADGFYEWETLDARESSRMRSHMRSGEPFAFGGIWDAWKEPDGDGFRASPSSRPIQRVDRDGSQSNAGDPQGLQTTTGLGLTQTTPKRPPVDLLRPSRREEMTHTGRSRVLAMSATRNRAVREAGLRQQNNQSATGVHRSGAFMPRPPREHPTNIPPRQRSRWISFEGTG